MAQPQTEGDRKAVAALGQVQVCLASAGTLLVTARSTASTEAQELITALRDDISGLIEDVKSVQGIVHDRYRG